MEEIKDEIKLKDEIKRKVLSIRKPIVITSLNTLYYNGVIGFEQYYYSTSDYWDFVLGIDFNITKQDIIDDVKSWVKEDTPIEEIEKMIVLHGFDNSFNIYLKRALLRVDEADQDFLKNIVSFFGDLQRRKQFDGNTK